MKREQKDSIYLALSITAVLTVMIGVWVVCSYHEAKAFNKITGKNVTTWDALWISLRVQEGVQHE